MSARASLVGLFLLLLAVPVQAVKPSGAAGADIRRFHLDRSSEPVRRAPDARSIAALRRLRRAHAGLQVAFDPRTGFPDLLTGFRVGALSRDPEAAARRFLDDHRDLLGIRTADLRLALARGRGHLLFQQTHRGLPVEFARVGVHLNRRGEIHHVTSRFDPAITVAPEPLVSEPRARDAAALDAGSAVGARGALVYWPDRVTGEVRLAWKFRFGADGGHHLWVYYIDAVTGTVLFRYDDLRYQTFVTSGTVRGGAFAISPFSTCTGEPMNVPFPYASVWVVDGSSKSVSGPDGFYSFGLQGRIFAALRGPYAAVYNDRQPNAHYDNGDGRWISFDTPLESAHPYAPGTDQTQTITGPGPSFGFSGALMMRVHFSSFDVGQSDNDGFNDDEVYISGADGLRTASYIGKNKGAFLSADVLGREVNVRLRADPSDEGTGYVIDKSSYFVFGVADPTSVHPTRSSYDIFWSTSVTADRTWDETNAFYQVNKMHDYWAAFSDTAHPIDVDEALPVAVHHGIGFQNAFYNPDHRNLFFGDGLLGACISDCSNILDCSFAADSTVVRHEYNHYALDKVYPLGNFGEAGAISEGLADYFAASSLGYARVGDFVNAGQEPLRNLDDGIGSGSNPALLCSSPNCSRAPANWFGEIHADSPILSQALWSIRQVAGASRADSLVYKSLFYFPSSFREFRVAMLQNHLDDYPAATTERAFIESAFTVHGISSTIAGQDALEPNDGPLTATDISAAGTRSGTVYPAADEDFYSFLTGPGSVEAVLTLPANAAVEGEYTALALTLLDDRNRVLADAMPVPENATVNGNCPDVSDCRTGQATVRLNHPLEAAGNYYIAVHCGYNDYDSVAACSSQTPYTLQVTVRPADPLAGSGLQVTREADELPFTLPLTAYGSGPVTPWRWDAPSHCAVGGSARLRDHNLVPLPETDSRTGSVPLGEVIHPMVTNNILSGRLRLHAGTTARYPAVAQAYLEILGVDAYCNVQPIGLSAGFSLAPAGGGSFSAWNNVMNPVKGDKATLRIAVSASGRTTLKLYTLNGRLVKTLFDRTLNGGASVDWDGRNEDGGIVASGVYLAHVEGPGINKTQKIVVVK